MDNATIFQEIVLARRVRSTPDHLRIPPVVIFTINPAKSFVLQEFAEAA
jgi:hypothetical protein